MPQLVVSTFVEKKNVHDGKLPLTLHMRWTSYVRTVRSVFCIERHSGFSEQTEVSEMIGVGIGIGIENGFGVT